MSKLQGIHDREGHFIVHSGGWCLDTVALSDNPVPLDYHVMRSDINWLVRLNWGYGSTGTYPPPDQMNWYIEAAAKYALACVNVFGFILGNEPNHEQERPGGIFLTPNYVATLFTNTRNRIKTINSLIRCITPPFAPYHASGAYTWTRYGKEFYENIQDADGIALHAYTRSSNPDDIRSEAKMGPPLDSTYSGFRTYQDALSLVPTRLQHLPAFLTEFNELLPQGWDNTNTGVVKEAYREIERWNRAPSGQKIHCLLLYRWPKYDKWYLEGREGVIQDFRESDTVAPEPPNQVFIPSVGTGNEPETPDSDRVIDQEAVEYGVKVEPLATQPAPGSYYWYAENIQFLNEQEAQGRHHFYFDTVDEAGNRLLNVPIYVWWSSGNQTVRSEAKPGELWSANFPFSPGKNAFSATINDNLPSESVTGAGMGQDTPNGFNPGIHTCVSVKWVMKQAAKRAVPASITVPTLIHPVKQAQISQKWGENADFYSRYRVDGVPLKGHNGLDFAVPEGTRVRSAADGVVVESAFDASGWGHYVKMQHSWGQTIYAHLREPGTPVGRTVKAGDTIGFSGNTGNSTGPHLHFGMRVDPFSRQDGWGGYTDPLPYLSQALTANIPTLLKDAAKEFGLSYPLLASLAWAESSFNQSAVSSEGAEGLMQITQPVWDDWAAQIGAKKDAQGNVRVGAVYLKFLLNYYEGNLYKALWAYNAGPGNVDLGNVPPETKEFANKVLHGQDLLNALGVKS